MGIPTFATLACESSQGIVVDVRANICFKILLYLLELLRDVNIGKLAEARGKIEVPKHGDTYTAPMTGKKVTLVCSNTCSHPPETSCHCLPHTMDNIGHLGQGRMTNLGDHGPLPRAL